MQDPSGRSFATTRWSLVAQAADRPSDQTRRALAELCQQYWPPLYAYARRRGLSASDAQDATQGFFTGLLEDAVLENADPDRGRFRSYLLTVFRRYLNDQRSAQTAIKRGGGVQIWSFDFQGAERAFQAEPSHDVSAEKLYMRRWAMMVLDRVLEQLRQQYVAKGRGPWFDALSPFLAGVRESDEDLPTTAQQLGLTTGAARVAIHRLRARYRDAIRQAVADTVDSGDQIDQEISELIEALQG